MTKNILVFLPMAGDGFSVSRETFISYNNAKTLLLARQNLLPFKMGAYMEYFPMTFPIDANRNECVYRALDGLGMDDGSILKPDITIWLDMDHTFPPDGLFNLLKHNLPIVCGVYHLKARQQGKMFFPVIFKKGEDYEKSKMYKPIVQYPEDELFEIDFTGMGCVQIWAEVFKKLEYPFFKYQPHPKNSPSGDAEFKHKHGIEDVTEDEWFYRQVREKTDYKIMCDPHIQCGHVGKMIYTHGIYKDYLKWHKEEFIKQHGEDKYYKNWENVCDMAKIKSAS